MTGGRFEFHLPDLGEGIEEAQVLAWKVQPGERVQAFQPLCDVESAKATVELTSPVAGRVGETCVEAGGTAHRGDVLVVIETEGAVSQDAPPASNGSAASEAEYFGIVGAPPPRPAAPAASPPRQQARSAERPIFAAPFVRKLARDLGVHLEDVPGSGPQGRVRAADVQAFANRDRTPSAEPSQPRAVAPLPGDERLPLVGLRKRIAEHMLQAVRHAPQVTSMDLFDVTELVRARRELAADSPDVKLTYLPFVVKAVVEALKAEPAANAVVDEAGGAIVLRRVYNVGVATAIGEGLVVPVVKDVDRLSILEIAAQIASLVDAARARRSTPEDLSGGTFTITSFGGLPGSPLYATPILNYPETAILGLGRVEQQPRVVDGAIVARDCMGVSFTFDHRALDGEGAARFMAVLRQVLEHPLQLLLRLK